MVSKKLMGARKLHCLGVIFSCYIKLRRKITGCCCLKGRAVAKATLIRKNIVTEKSEYLVEANQSIWELAQDAQKPLNQFMKENQLRSSYIKRNAIS